YREANQQICPQCQKREFPHMKREQAQNLTQVEMFPPELDISTNLGQDQNQEGYRRQCLFMRECAKESERQLEESKKKPKNQQHPNEIPHQERQISYLLNLHRNAQRRAEQAYQSRYGELTEDDPNKDKGKIKNSHEQKVFNQNNCLFHISPISGANGLFITQPNPEAIATDPQSYAKYIQRIVEISRYLHIGISILGLVFLGLGVYYLIKLLGDEEDDNNYITYIYPRKEINQYFSKDSADQITDLLKRNTSLEQTAKQAEANLVAEQKSHQKSIKDFTTQSATREHLIAQLAQETSNARKYEKTIKRETDNLEKECQNLQGNLKN
ncbi:16132_t:CDS:2, partial [Funneliformis geosporum]